MQLIALFNLKPGVTAKQYEDWARATDLPTVRQLPSIASFTVSRSLGLLGSDAAPPYQYVEIIEVADDKQFGLDVATPAMTAIAAQFQDLADVIFLVTQSIETAKA